MQENRSYTFFGTLIVIGILCIFYVYHQAVSVPSTFPVGKNFTVLENESVRSISYRLQEAGYTNSALLFRAGISFLNKDKTIHVGGYVFDAPYSLLGIINKFAEGHPDAPLLSITIPEGSETSHIALLITKALPTISLEKFQEVVTRNAAEGKLFPSTYFLLPSYTAEDIVMLMTSTFTKKVGSMLTSGSVKEPLSKPEDVITLASILEGEAKTPEDMKIVAGILLARLEKGMPLQVDVAKETYKEKGLPTAPLNNPGLTAISAALNPTTTPYLYYLTGKDGKMHYAKTFEEHKRNIQKYLK